MTNGLSNLSLSNNHVTNGCHGSACESGDHLKYPVDLDLDHVLGKMPQKVNDDISHHHRFRSTTILSVKV